MAVLVYDYAQKQWDIVPSENAGEDSLKISPQLISAYAVISEEDEPTDQRKMNRRMKMEIHMTRMSQKMKTIRTNRMCKFQEAQEY